MTSDVVRWLRPHVANRNSADRTKIHVNSQCDRDSLLKSSFYKLMVMWLVININVNVVVSVEQLGASAAGDDYRSKADAQIDRYEAVGDEVDDLPTKHFTSTWAVHIPGGEAEANRVAAEHEFINLGQVCSI